MSITLDESAAMPACPVLKLSDAGLHERCEQIPDQKTTREVSAELWAALDEIGKLYNFTRHTGIAAPQIGRMVELFVAGCAGVRRNFLWGHVLRSPTERKR
jgi:hypothetical protein